MKRHPFVCLQYLVVRLQGKSQNCAVPVAVQLAWLMTAFWNRHCEQGAEPSDLLKASFSWEFSCVATSVLPDVSKAPLKMTALLSFETRIQQHSATSQTTCSLSSTAVITSNVTRTLLVQLTVNQRNGTGDLNKQNYTFPKYAIPRNI
jgi:outer membrane protein W